jgi:hypothetical protein
MHQQVTSPPATVTPGPPLAGVVSPRRRKSRRRRKILIGIGAVLLLWIIGAIVNSKREKPIPVTTDKATRRTIVQIVSATGKIQPETEVKISPEVAGEIIELPVEDGIAVKKGDLLVKIKPDFYIAQRGQSEAAYKSSLAGLSTGEANLRKAEAEYNRNADLFRTKLISDSAYDEARAKAGSIYEYLHAVTDVVLEFSRVLYFACNTAGSIGQDTRERELVRMNFIAKAHAYTPPSGDGDGGTGGDEGDNDSPPGGKDPNPDEFP